MRAKVFFIISGVKYWWSGWFGSQLASIEWKNVPAGTERDLFIDYGAEHVRVTVFRCTRRWIRYDVSWSISLSGDTDNQNKQINNLKEKLRALI